MIVQCPHHINISSHLHHPCQFQFLSIMVPLLVPIYLDLILTKLMFLWSPNASVTILLEMTLFYKMCLYIPYNKVWWLCLVKTSKYELICDNIFSRGPADLIQPNIKKHYLHEVKIFHVNDFYWVEPKLRKSLWSFLLFYSQFLIVTFNWNYKL